MQDIKNTQDATLQLTEQEQVVLAKRLGELFGRLDAERAMQLDDIKQLRDGIFGGLTGAQSAWNADYKSADLYEMAQTLKSHLMESLYSHPDAMFDVSGQTPEAQQHANEQKSALVSAFEQMELPKELERCVDGLIETGEATMFVGWRSEYKTTRRQKTTDELVLLGDEELTLTEERLEYDGVSVRYVPCEDFVFDTQEKLGWDSRLKVYRSYASIDELFGERNNNYLDAQKSAQVLELVETKRKKQKHAATVGGSTLEVLEVWGDFELAGGKRLKNWLITVVEREIIVRSEANPYLINPFIHMELVKDPKTRRGLSPLKVALPLNAVSSTILNKQLDALSLIINPPYLAPKGCFKGEQVVKPGKIIEYDAALMPTQPVPLRFESALVGWEFIKYFKTAMETSTGVYRNMSGDFRSQSKTATEVSYSVGAQSVRLNSMIESINRKLIIPMVEKTAAVLAGYRFGSELVPVMRQGVMEFIEVSDAVRQSGYFYRFGDRKAGLERKYRMKELYDTIFQLAKLPEVAQKVDWEECFKFALEQFGIENTKQFMKQEAPAAAQPTQAGKPQQPNPMELLQQLQQQAGLGQ